ncbi:MAG: hypothetical protein SFY32_04830 [Bacteroidota bacterium]|nr:hypothetical protein [Bacteroidota bacterium]
MDLREVELNSSYNQLCAKLSQTFGKKPDLNGILFLIGVQELGKGVQNFSKEQKQDLMHIATCKLLSQAGFYSLSHKDQDGWPHWNKVSDLPFLSVDEQEKFLKMMAIEYFNEIGI